MSRFLRKRSIHMGLFDKAPAPLEAPEYIEVGQIVNTHGVRGEVKVQPWDVSAERFCGFKTSAFACRAEHQQAEQRPNRVDRLCQRACPAGKRAV